MQQAYYLVQHRLGSPCVSAAFSIPLHTAHSFADCSLPPLLCLLLQGFSCKSGSVCKRQSEYFWMCTPGTRTLAAPAATPLAGGAAAAADQPAVPGVDLLEVSAPAAAPAGSPVQLAASLTRMGAPVSGAVVEFVVADSTGNGSATVQAVTDGEGIARAVLPVEAAGAAGSSSTVSAVTPDGKAMGAKGTVALSSAEVGITWQ